MRFFRTLVLIAANVAGAFYLGACAPLHREPYTQNDTSTQISPERKSDVDWQSALAYDVARDNESVLDSAHLYTSTIDTSALPEWSDSESALQNKFEMIRDERIYADLTNRYFLRRSTWLYTSDGCYMRAAHLAKEMARTGNVRPGKVFAFGNLKFVSKFAPSGVQLWSYHVAAAYRFRSETIILDPAIEPLHPIKLSSWIEKMRKPQDQVSLSVCDTYAYGIHHRCVGGDVSSEINFESDVQRFLPLEWEHLQKNGFDPFTLLGKEPPWIASGTGFGNPPRAL